MTTHDQARDRLQCLQAELETLTQTVDKLTGKDKVKQCKDIERLQSQIANLEAFLRFKISDRITDGKQLGMIKDLTLSHGGLPEAWISWYGKVQIPEQPSRLISEPILEEHLKIGDVIRFKGQQGVISQFLGDGRVKTTEGVIIDFNQGEVAMTENQGNSMNKDDEMPLVESEIVNDDDTTSDEAKLIINNELSPEEEAELERLEKIVEESFVEAGRALKLIRDLKLYRKTHPTFEEYCQDRFGFTRRHINYTIAAAQVVDNLKMGTNCSQIVPTNEAQCRPLTSLPPEQQRTAWNKAVEKAGGKVPSNRIVKEVIDELKQRQIPRYAPNPFHEGDIVEIIVKGNPDLRGRGGQWGIISEVFEFSCMVKVWDGTIQVRTENMKDLVIPPEQKDAVRGICERCHRLIQVEGINDMAKAALASLSKKTWLDEVEEQILGYIEGIYLGGER